MSWYSSTVDTPIGPFTVIASGDAVIASGWTADEQALAGLVRLARQPRQRADLGDITKAVLAYFEGDLAAVEGIPVDQRGGDFLEHAWRVLRKVHHPVSYTEFAALAGRPAAVRAAAQACARNAAALFVPCHRVLRSDGSLGGFRYGLPAKRWLLDHEASYR